RPEGERLMLLSPVIQDRKGEHVQVLDQLKAEGFVRARIDGRVAELDEAPKLDLRRKHTVEAVVDRFRVRADLPQRLAESFETATRLSGGLAVVASMDDPKAKDVVFSARFACPECGYSLSELEPRLFSFNNPAGACPQCDGLGVIQFFDPDLIVQNRDLSLPGGAIRGWDRRNAYYFQLIKGLARHYRFDVDTPFRKLPQKVQQVILHGSGEEAIEFEYLSERRGSVRRRHPFEGVIPNMERRYRETDSILMREELAKFLGSRPCPGCDGTRLNRTARHVYVGDLSLPQVTGLTVLSAQEFFT